MFGDEPSILDIMNQSNPLPRVLGLWGATAVVVGTVIGSGVFKKASIVSADVPGVGFALLAWVVVGVLTLMGSLVLAEVAIQIPEVGGVYAFLKRSYGRWAGFLWGWVEFWMIRSASIAALATVFSQSLSQVTELTLGEGLSRFGQLAVTLAAIGFVCGVNLVGTRFGAHVQVFVTLIKIGSLGIIALIPFLLPLFVEPQVRPSLARLSPAWTGFDLFRFTGALVAVFWAYHGWMNLAPIAGEVKEPQKNLPRSLMIGVFTIILLYVGVNLSYYLVLTTEEITHTEGKPVAGVYMLRLIGSTGAMLISMAIMISVLGSLNGNMLVGPRVLFAMGQDGLAPRKLQQVSAHSQTPRFAILALACWCMILVISVALLAHTKDPFDVMTDFAMFGAIAFETMGVASIFILRRRHAHLIPTLPYRCPLYPILPIVYVAAMGFILANMFFNQTQESLTGTAFVLVGLLVYRFVVPKESEKL